MEKINHLFIICGEASGDLNAANLAKEILKIDPQLKISCVGGELLRASGAEVFYDIRDISAIGFFDVLKKLPKFFALKKLVLSKIAAAKPDAIIFVDFSGFNLRLAKAINTAIPTIYYISPQVWASRASRIKTIRKYIDKMIVLFKFEQNFYKKYGIDAVYAGHPLLDSVRPAMQREELLKSLGLSAEKTLIALLPGSRKQEVLRILPLMLKAGSLIRKERDAQFVIAKTSQVDWEVYNRLIKRFNLEVKIVEGKTYDCLNAADFALVASGTATLETAILGVPFILIYKMSLLNYILYRPQVKLPYIGMANIVAGKKIIPEFIQFGACPAKIAKKALSLLKNPAELENTKNELSRVKSSLGEKGASARAAKIVINFLTKLSP